MRVKQGTQLGWLAILSVLGWAGVAMAQNFAWPPTRDNAPPNAALPPATENFQEIETDPTGIASPIPTVVGPNVATKPVMPSGGGQLDWRVLDNTNGPHVAMIFDPVRQVFAVYHVDSASGQIMLKSVRNLSADLKLDQFNSSNPAPKDIQSMLDEAR